MDELDLVKRRIAARRWAEEYWKAADDREVFCQRVIQLRQSVRIIPKPIERAQINPMSDAEAKAFEARTIEFGAHRGSKIGDLLLAYLCRLIDPSPDRDLFLLSVHRYLRNPAVKRRAEEET